MLTRMRRRSWGQGLAEVAVVCSIMTSMAGGGAGAAWGVLDTARRTRTISNLKQIYLAISMFADDNEGLPNAEFYPNVAKDKNAVKNSPRSIVKIVGGGMPASMWVSPAAPSKFQEAGLTFVWNTQANGKHLDQLDRTWLLMDMNAAAYLIPDFVPRASTGYLVLYSDGSVKYEHVPPKVVPENLKDQLAQQVSRLTGKPAAGGGGGGQPGAQGGQEGDNSEANVPADPDAEVEKKEEQARESNPDEDDAADD